jgi:preprotein translocase subunit SecG
VTFDNYLNLAQMLISFVLIVVVLLQTRGGDIGAAFGGGSSGSSFRTRRGLEKTLFQLTIVLAIIFVGISALSVRYAG